MLISARFQRSFSLVLSSIFLIAGSARCFGAPQESIKIVSGSEQRTTYAAPFEKLLQVQVTDARTHKVLAGILVDFTPSSGLIVSSASAITNESGFAAVTATGSAVGTSSVEAFVEGSPKARVRFESLKVTKAPITIVPANLTSTVGMIPPMTEYQLTGFMNGETVESAHVTGTALLTTVATSHSHDANYAIKGWPGTLSSPNYTFVPGFGTLVLSGTQTNAAEAEEEQDADSISPIVAEDPATIQPALNSVSTEENKSASDRQVRRAVQGSASTQRKAAESARSIRAAVPSNSAVVVRQRPNSVAVRSTLLPGTSSTANQTRTTAVRSTMLGRSQQSLDSTLSSTKPQVAATGLKAPGSN